MVDENVVSEHSDEQLDAAAQSAGESGGSVEGAQETAAEDVNVVGEEKVVEEGSVAVEAENDAPEASAEMQEEEFEDEGEVNELGFRPDEIVTDEDLEEDEDDDEDASPIAEFVEEVPEEVETGEKRWYILKVQVNRENSICDALLRRVKVHGLETYFGDVLVPTEDVREFNKNGKPKVVKRKLYPGYIVVHMEINDDSWFLVRETPGIGDFTGAVGKPAALSEEEINRIIATTRPEEEDEGEDAGIKTAIRFKVGDRVRVKEGYFQNHEGEISSLDERNGRVTVMINIFGRLNPVELDHWHVEDL